MKKIIVLYIALLCCSVALYAKIPIKALIVTGQNNHNWQLSCVTMQKYLDESGLFTTDIAKSPEQGKDMSSFRPDFSAYQVVILDYNGDSWPDATKQAFVEYVRKGGGVVVYHAADNAFRNWKEYNEIIGLGGWEGRNETDGPYVYWKDGKIIRDTSAGLGGSHGKQHAYELVVRDKKHPIMKGLPDKWTHPQDELYDRLRGPAQNMTVLATAYSDKETGGSGREEPALFTITYGKGRIFHTILGHAGSPGFESTDFIVTLLRGTEWAATGKVSQKVPATFLGK